MNECRLVPAPTGQAHRSLYKALTSSIIGKWLPPAMHANWMAWHYSQGLSPLASIQPLFIWKDNESTLHSHYANWAD